MVYGFIGNYSAQFGPNFLPGVIKPFFNKNYPVSPADFLKKMNVTKFVKGHLVIAEDVKQHMALTARQTIANLVV